jgi:hypothetical protein
MFGRRTWQICKMKCLSSLTGPINLQKIVFCYDFTIAEHCGKYRGVTRMEVIFLQYVQSTWNFGFTDLTTICELMKRFDLVNISGDKMPNCINGISQN